MAVRIEKLLELVVARGASDLHLSVGAPPVLRVDGRLKRVSVDDLTAEDTANAMRALAPEIFQEELARCGGADFAVSFEERARFRVSVFRQRGRVGLVLRLIPQTIRSLEDLGVPEAMRALCARPRGLVLVTGPTGSGKTTTLAASIDAINGDQDRHILTIEDPIEYIHAHRRSLVTQRELGRDVDSFHEAIRRGLRQDPDVILVGELRDLETVSAAITAAETGHLVLATLHTVGASETVHRLVDAFPADQQNQVRLQLASCLLAVLSQALLPRVDRGRVAAFELMVKTPAIAHHIRENRVHMIDNELQTGAHLGMQRLDDHLLQLFVEGQIGYQHVMEKARNPDEVSARIKELTSGG